MRTDFDDEFKKLLEENLKVSQQILKSTEKTRKYIHWMQVTSFLRLAIIVLPIVLAIIYLPPLVQKAFKTYQQFMGSAGDSANLLEQFKNSPAANSLPQLEILKGLGIDKLLEGLKKMK